MKNIKSRNGKTTYEFIIIAISLSLIAIFFAFMWCSRHVFGNKQIIDFNHQNFNVAYVQSDSGKWERINIKAWKDWKQSDAIQIVKPNGNAIYTHLCNVKLCTE